MNDNKSNEFEANESVEETAVTSDQDPEQTKSQVESEDDAPSEAELNQNSELVAKLADAEAEIAKLKDAFLRSKAEEDNVRRRAEKEVASSRKFAIEGFAKEMLNVFDSLKLAIANEPAEDADETVKNIFEGSKITLNQLNSAFAKFSVKEISPEVGDKLDPNLHQAMSLVDSEDIKSGCIITVIQSGFELNDRLIRPAMVVVAK